MTESTILSKLRHELNQEITTERQVVYILVEIRKAIELSGKRERYFALDFYCSWALHTQMSRAGAKKILERFDQAYPIIVRRQRLPDDLKREIDQTIKLRLFRDELRDFLASMELPDPLTVGEDKWPRFLYLYGQVIDHCALVLEGKHANLASIDRVSVHLAWIIHDFASKKRKGALKD